MYLNKVILFGNLTQDPELKSLPNGNSVVNFGIATNRSWKDQQGQKQESVEYHSIVGYGKPAEIIYQYMKKGSSIMIEGRLQTRSWESQDGKKNYKTEIIIETFQLGPKTTSGSNSNNYSQAKPSSRPQQITQNIPSEELPTVNIDEDEINLEEIPF